MGAIHAEYLAAPYAVIRIIGRVMALRRCWVVYIGRMVENTSGAAPGGGQGAALRIVGQYALFAALWILLSDSLVAWLFSDVRVVALVSTLKGWLFVVVTSMLLFLLISRQLVDFNRMLHTVQQREGELRDSRRQMLEAQRIAALGSYELDVASGIWQTSDISDQLLGLDAHFERSMAGWQRLVHPDDWGWLYARFNSELLTTTKPFILQYRIIRPIDGQERWIQASGVLELDPAGVPHRLHGTFQDITEHRRVQLQINDSRNQLQATLDALPDLLFEIDIEGCIHQYHSHRSDLLAAPPALFLGKRFAEVLPELAAQACQQAIDEAQHKGFSAGVRYALQLPQGERWFELSVAPLLRAEQALPRFIIIARDITERRDAEKQLELAALVFSHAREGIMITDAQGVLVDVNDAFTRITGYAREEVLGRNAKLLASGRHGKEFFGALWVSLLQAGFWSGEVWNRRKDGDIYAELLTISSVRNEGGQVVQYVALFSDITALKRYQSELETIAHFDVLTGLPNRLLLADRLQQAMAQSARRGQTVVLVYLDLDGFKAVNDAYGHAVGDRLLQALGQRLSEHLREGDTLARLGGDEFVAILIDLDRGEPVLNLIERLLGAAAEPFVLDNLSLQISASAGVTSYPQVNELDADQLLRQADQAMYQAKLAGKNRFHVFDTQHDSDMRGHFESLERVRLALQQQEFVLHYQPKVHMRSGRLMGVEALIRWQHPQRGLMPPLDFLPAIEDHLLSIAVGEWVMEAALCQYLRWQDQGLDIPVSVNVGALQLQQPDFVDRLHALLQRYPAVPADRLQFEILETSALRDVAQVTAVIAACRHMGIAFALDDFGTGYSSLTYLRELPVALLKIDQSFVRNMLDHTEDQAILRGIVDLARAFGREVIAEGVETEAHGSLLLRMGCELAQGYGIARPMEGAAIVAWQQSWRPCPEWLCAD